MKQKPVFSLVAFCIGITALWANSAVGESDALIKSLDLTRPDMAKVKAAADLGDMAAARKAFAQHLRTRTNVVWYFDPASPPKDLTSEEMEEAQTALRHEFTILHVPWRFDGPINWRFNPTTLPDSKVAVTHEWTWGLNRHTFWPMLAKAYLATGDAKYGREVASQIADWCARNPAPEQVPPRYFSPWRQIEAGLRMCRSWPESFFLLVNSPRVFPDDVMLAMVETMRDHAEFLAKFPTRGNWLTMESNGLFHVGTLFPEFKRARAWRDLAIARQREQLDIQVYPDGAQIELAPGYHNVALRMFVKTLDLAERNRVPVPDGYREALQRMFDMNLWVMMPDRTSPDFNDSGRGGGVHMLEQGLTYFPDRQDWKWLVTDGQEGQAPKETSHFFPYAGWAVMRSDWSRDARCLIMEGGPFGFSHQHEDKLSFIMDAYGAHLVAEAGIYPYFQSKSRDYSIGAPGHNVVFVDGLGQHRYGRAKEKYLTQQPLDLGWRTTPEFDYVAAEYGTGEVETWGAKDQRGFVHTRRILFMKPDYWVVIDTVVPSDDAEHTYAAAFHLDAPDARMDPASKRITTINPDRPTVAIVPLPVDGLDVSIVKGETQPTYRGWIANDTLELQAVPTPYYTRRAKGPVHTLYVFAPVPAGKTCPIARVEPGGVAGAAISARIVFAEHAVYGQGTDEISLMADGEVVARRAGGARFSSRESVPSAK